MHEHSSARRRNFDLSVHEPKRRAGCDGLHHPGGGRAVLGVAPAWRHADLCEDVDWTIPWRLTSRVATAAESIDELDARVTKATKIRQDDLEEHTKLQKLEVLRTIARQQCRLQFRTHACQRHQGVPEFTYEPKHEEFWKKVELPGGVDDSYVCIEAKASNYFMPKKTLTRKPHKDDGGKEETTMKMR